MMAKSDPTKPLTVRLSEEEYAYLKEYAGKRRVSLNCLVAEALAEYRAKIERGIVLAEIQAFQEELRDGWAEGSDSVDLLRQLREARSDLGNRGGDRVGETARPLPVKDEGTGR